MDNNCKPSAWVAYGHVWAFTQDTPSVEQRLNARLASRAR